MAAQCAHNFNFANSPEMGDFRPKFCIFGEKFCMGRKFSNRLKFGEFPGLEPPAMTPLIAIHENFIIITDH